MFATAGSELCEISFMIAGLDFLGLHQGRAAPEPGGGRGHDRQQRGPLAPSLPPLHQPEVRVYTVKKRLPTVPSPADVPYQTLPGREYLNYSSQRRVW
jgi:hypothetical protein